MSTIHGPVGHGTDGFLNKKLILVLEASNSQRTSIKIKRHQRPREIVVQEIILGNRQEIIGKTSKGGIIHHFLGRYEHQETIFPISDL